MPSVAIDSRVACRYSSRRWADIVRGNVNNSAMKPICSSESLRRRQTLCVSVSLWLFEKCCLISWLRELRAVIVCRVPIKRMDVIRARSLRCIFDHHRGTLDPEVGGASVLRGPAPGKLSVFDICLDLGHLDTSSVVIDDADPFVHQIQQHGALSWAKGRGPDPFGLNHFAVMTGAENHILHLVIEDGLLLLCRT